MQKSSELDDLIMGMGMPMHPDSVKFSDALIEAVKDKVERLWRFDAMGVEKHKKIIDIAYSVLKERK